MKSGKEAFYINWHAPPIEIVETTSSYANLIRSKHEAGFMEWRLWEGPKKHLPLVLLHGGWGSWMHWIKVIPKLAAHRSVLVADLPAMGDSSDLGMARDISTVSRIVEKGLREILPERSKFDLCGFSFGAIVAAGVALKQNINCRSLTVVGGAGFGSLHHVVEGLKNPSQGLPAAEKINVHKNNLRLLMLADETAIDDLSVYIHQKNLERGRFRSRHISLGSGLLEALPDLDVKLGGIWGELDSTAGGMNGIKERRGIFRRLQPDCPFSILKGCGHWAMYEKPDEFVSSLQEHLVHYEYNAS